MQKNDTLGFANRLHAPPPDDSPRQFISVPTYKVVLDSCKRAALTCAFAMRNHNPRFPVTDNWPHRRTGRIRASAGAGQGEPVWLVGHSLGGMVSIMVAARHPRWVRGVVMLDSPIVGGWNPPPWAS